MAAGETVHCVAAEPHATFLRVSVTERRDRAGVSNLLGEGWRDAGQEVAYTIAVLGRLRRGYRVLQLRGLLGTRIELSCALPRLELSLVATRHGEVVDGAFSILCGRCAGED